MGGWVRAGHRRGRLLRNGRILLPAALFLTICLALLAPAAALDVGVQWDLVNEPELTTEPATNVTKGAAIVHGNLTFMGDVTTLNVSFEWGLSPALGLETDARTVNATGPFEAPLVGLEAGVTYYFRAKAVGNGTGYGQTLSFTTEAGMTPEDVTILVALFLFAILTIISFAFDQPVFLVFAGIVGILFGLFLLDVTGQFFLTAVFIGISAVFMLSGSLLAIGEYGGY
jgi:hypothetical protein